MSLFNRSNGKNTNGEQSALAEVALRAIHDGVIIIDKSGVIKFINPAATNMTGFGNNALGLDYGLVIKLESKEGRELFPNENLLVNAIQSGQPLESFQATIIPAQSDKKIPVSISVIPSEGFSQDKIITIRNIAKELEGEGEKTEFISTASHEMRTPVATIDGYLSLCLNPKTATIDARAQGYLTAAQAASKHLGKLFQDLLDVTKLDDGRIRPTLQPVDLVNLVRTIANDHQEQAKNAKLAYTIGADSPASFGGNNLKQIVYGFVDVNFMREIMDNLIDNAIKYTPEGGSIYVNVRGDGERALVNVTDTGIGISAEDLGHVFQKFYRVDNSDTRTNGGTGLGLYLVKQRAEAMGGKVWAESAFGEGSTFYVSLPRLSNDEYEKRMIAVRNLEMQKQVMATAQPQLPSQPLMQPQSQLQSPGQPQPITQVTPQIIQPTPPPGSPPIQSMSNQTNINLNGGVKWVK